MIKALFFDLDGTLLNSQKKISDKTRMTLEKCRQKGYKLFIATGRAPLLDKMLSWDEDTFALFDGCVYNNGGCLVVGGREDYIVVPGEIVQKIIDIVENYTDVNIALQTKCRRHAFHIPLNESDYIRWGAHGEALTLKSGIDAGVIKMLVFCGNLIDSVLPIDEDLLVELESACKDSARFYLTDKGRCVQIMEKSVSKVHGIEKICRHFAYNKDEVAVFGDDLNDAEMLSFYPCSVAMGNAEAAIKNIAKHVTTDNDSEGIHEAICNILKLL